MFSAATSQLSPLHFPTLAFVAICITALLGLLLILAWAQQRNVRALAWWGSAYLIGASSIALWGAPSPLYRFPTEIAQAMTFLACGMIWNGVRLFHGRRLLPTAAFAGAVAWMGLCQLPLFPENSNARIALGVGVVATYTFFIAFELNRERRKSLYSRLAAVAVPFLHAAIFLLPLAMQSLLPQPFAAGWLTVFTLETMLYAVGTAFIVLLMVKDNDVTVFRNAASIDPLTGLLNRGAFLEGAHSLCARQGDRGEPITLVMFDLDHFKSINDCFGHAAGDEVLRVFAGVARSSMRASDLFGRLGGEEFAVILPEAMDLAARVAERLRAAFEAAGVTIDGHEIGATVSMGAATSYERVTDLSALMARADAALYRAKNSGRNRLYAAQDEPLPSAAAQRAARKRANHLRIAAAQCATSRLPSAR